MWRFTTVIKKLTMIYRRNEKNKKIEMNTNVWIIESLNSENDVICRRQKRSRFIVETESNQLNFNFCRNRKKLVDTKWQTIEKMNCCEMTDDRLRSTTNYCCQRQIIAVNDKLLLMILFLIRKEKTLTKVDEKLDVDAEVDWNDQTRF